MRKTIILNFHPAALMLGAMLACGSAFAGTAAGGTSNTNAAGKPDAMQAAQARFQQDKAVCMAGKSNQDQQTCLKEAGAALEQAKRGALDDRAAPCDANTRKRCEALPTNDRVSCLARMDGAGTKSGTEASGGIYRELSVITSPAPEQKSGAVTKDNDQGAVKK